MDADLTQRILRDPRYQELKAKRSRFGWWLTLAMMLVYYGFILLVAFDKPFLATKLGAGVTTVGMPLGLAVIVFTVLITGLYVRRANSEYDALTERIRPHWEKRSQASKAETIERTPLRRVAEAADQARVICFLASADADFVTGLTIDVTGGV